MAPKPVSQKLGWSAKSHPYSLAFWSLLNGVVIWKFKGGSSGRALTKIWPFGWISTVGG
jgi:hypothetical protein